MCIFGFLVFQRNRNRTVVYIGALIKEEDPDSSIKTTLTIGEVNVYYAILMR